MQSKDVLFALVKSPYHDKFYRKFKPVDPSRWDLDLIIMKEFCLVSGLKFGVENFTDYNKAKDPIPFRRRVFSSDLDGRPIRGNYVLLLIESDVFKRLDDNDAVSLCCVGILQLVLLGVEDRRHVPNWILSDPTNETETKSYSIEGFAWGFKTWILESFQAATDDYYTRYRRHPRIVAWSSKHKFYRNMLKPMLHGQLPVERLVPDETEARSRWWVSSRAYFDGRSFEEEHIPRHLNRNNYFEVPSEMYQDFEEHRRGYQQMKEKNADMYEKMTRFIEDMRQVPEANTTPIITDQHFGVSDISGFQSYQPGTSNWQNPMTSRCQDAGILDPNLCDRARREPQPSIYMLSPYTNLPPTTILTKKKVDKTKKKGKTTKLSLLNLGNNFADESVSVDDVTITGVHQTDNYFNYETLDPDKHMDSWVQILIRERTENANWTLAKSGTVCLHPENNRFMILTDPHNIGTLDGSVRHFPSWNDVTWVLI
nr:hypothetical protein [Tanacetum cinerariifolium]